MTEQAGREEETGIKNALSRMGMPRFSTRMLNSADSAIFDSEGRVWVGSGVSQEKIKRIADSYAQPILDNPQNLRGYEIN